MRWQELPADVLATFRAGSVLPAHPLALDAERRLDERRQRALTRYYLDAGAGGLAVGVHTTQFAIRDVGLYRPVLELAARDGARRGPTARSPGRRRRRPARAGGRRGPDRPRARLPRRLRQPRGLQGRRPRTRCSTTAARSPPRCRWSASTSSPRSAASCSRAPSGALRGDRERRRQSRWRRSTATARSTSCTASRRPARRSGSRSTPATTTTSCSTFAVPFRVGGATTSASSAGCSATGRSGRSRPWTCWSAAGPRAEADAVPADLLALDGAVTDCNAAFFDVANAFPGCIAGIHEVLRRQGLLEGRWCLDPDEALSPGQARGDRPRVPHLPRAQRRRVRGRQPRALARRLIPAAGCHHCPP